MAQITKQASGWSYRASWRTPDGKRHTHQEGGFLRKSAAQVAAAEYEEKAASGANLDRQAVTLIDYWDSYIAAYKATGKSDNSIYRYGLLREHLERVFAGRELRSITPMEWQTFLNDLAAGKDLAHPRERSRDFVSKFNSYMRAVVKTAINEQIMRVDFTLNAQINGQKNSGRIKYLELADFDALTALARDTGSFMHLGAFAVYVGAVTGMRVSEVLALTWDSIDMEHNIIHVTRSWDHVKAHKFKPTKTPSSVRDIDVPASTIKAFRRIKAQQAEFWFKHGYRDSDKMVFRSFRREVMTGAGCNVAIRKLQNKLGIAADKQITFHGLRHTHVSFLLSKGIDIYYISRRLGHSDINITLSVYSHLLESQRQEEAAKTVALVDQLGQIGGA